MRTTQMISRQSVGFTLIEVLVASGILVVATGAMLSLGRASLRTQSLAMERSQAYHLLQEGFEVVRQIRDTTYIDQTLTNGTPNAWDSYFPLQTTQGVAVAPFWNGNARRWQLVTDEARTASPIEQGIETITLNNVPFHRSIMFVPVPTQYDSRVPLIDEQGSVSNGFRDSARLIRITVEWESQGEIWSVTGTTLLTNWKKIG